MRILINKTKYLYLICTIISFITFNKLDKTILFMSILYIVYNLGDKKRIYLKIYNK